MGTYIYARLINKDEESIKKANKSIKKAGYPTEIHNNTTYGFFTSRKQIAEDVRYMNKDEEGLKQMPHWPRPIKEEDLTQLFWNEIGCGVIKISGCDDERQNLVDIVKKWIFSADGKRMIDFEKSDNLFE